LKTKTNYKLLTIHRCQDCTLYERCEYAQRVGTIPEECPLPDERPPIGTNFNEQYDKI
jgi:hypothetical protein